MTISDLTPFRRTRATTSRASSAQRQPSRRLESPTSSNRWASSFAALANPRWQREATRLGQSWRKPSRGWG